MKILRLAAACATVMAISSPAHAQAELVPTLSMIDFAVGWKKYVNKFVIVKGGIVFGADQDQAILHAGGVSIALHAPFQNPEALRFVLENCSEIKLNPNCALDVLGRVTESDFSDKVFLANPDLWSSTAP